MIFNMYSKQVCKIKMMKQENVFDEANLKK